MEKFLIAIENSDNYYAKNDDGSQGLQVLSTDGNGKVTLLRNVNFGGIKATEGHTIPANITFDGNHHCIYNMTNNLFNSILGKVKNLKIDQVVISYEFNDEEKSAITHVERALWRVTTWAWLKMCGWPIQR